MGLNALPLSFKEHLMAKPNNKGRNKGGFIMITHHLKDSPAYLSLSVKARAVYIEIIRRYTSFNNGDIPLSCREAGELCNIGKGTAGDAFKELIEKGFIKIGENSAFNMKTRKSRRWILTHEVYKGNSPSNEWKTWK